MSWRRIKKADIGGPQMLVTNNRTARNAFGEMSHIWVSHIFAGSIPEETGKYVGWDGDRFVSNLTHCCKIPMPTPENMLSAAGITDRINQLEGILHSLSDVEQLMENAKESDLPRIRSARKKLWVKAHKLLKDQP